MKEGIGWIYKQFDGYASMAADLGDEGRALAFELREGHHRVAATPS